MTMIEHSSKISPQQVGDVLAAIINGEIDGMLPALASAINDRSQIVRNNTSRQVAISLKAGDQVQIIKCSPKYLIGATATVSKIEGTKIHIFLYHSNRKFSRNHAITCDASMLRATGRAGEEIPTYDQSTGLRVS